VEGDPWASLAATAPSHESAESSAPGCDEKLDSLLQRINRLTQGGTGASAAMHESPKTATDSSSEPDEFVPREPQSLVETGLSPSDVESLILKLLLSRGDLVGRDIAEHIQLPFVLVDELLRQLKRDQLVVYRSSAAMNDYMYQLTDLGRERARRQAEHCSYFGAAPVTLAAYIASVKAQSLEKQHPTQDDLRHAFADLLISPSMLMRLGPAINSGRGLFLFGAPGNGKTSIAERVTAAFGQAIWIPRAIGVDGEIMRLYDPMNHEIFPIEKNEGLLDCSRIDRRWVRIRRPTIIVGGELTMDNLEVTLNRSTGTSEAPVQMKSNCGTLVIDDFGRQRMSTDELLNRWIVPLEKRYDYLNMANGKKIQVPFDQLIIFSTNLEPRDLVDDAFLRRIPYKIEVVDPTQEEFQQLFRLMCKSLNIVYNDSVVEYLIERHYLAKQRPFRCCQPRDLLLQVRNRCRYEQRDPELSIEAVDFAVETYFAVM
jgi:predicted ATPase with chaperone activity